MSMLIAGMVLFFGTHLARVLVPDFRDSMRARLGPLGWKAVYSITSIGGFVLIVMGYAAIRWSSPMLWGPAPGWMRMVVGLAMLPVLVVFLAAYLPGHIRAKLRHPMVIATVIWAALHLLVNGRVADLLLFGGFFAWGHIVMIASFRRPRPEPARAPSLLWDGVAVVAGIGAWWWLAFGGGHMLLFGVPVM